MSTNQQDAALKPIIAALSQNNALSSAQAKSIANAINQYVESKQREAGAQLKHEMGKDIAGYGTLPAILAVAGSVASKEPIVPILLALGGLALTAFVPELREKVNVYNWYEWLQQRQEQQPRQQPGNA